MEGLIGGFIEHETEIRAETSNERVGFPYPSFYRKLLINGEPPETLQKEPQKWDFHNAFAEGKITKEWEVAEYMVIKHAIYVVVGIFPHGHANPRERVVFVKKPEHLFWGLLWASLRLRGVFGTFLSLRHVKGFRLYKVCVCILFAKETPAFTANPVIYSATPAQESTNVSTLIRTVSQTCC